MANLDAQTHRGRLARTLLLALVLVVLTAAVYSRVGSHEFLAYDDNFYITENPHIRSGLTGESITWAFTTNREGNWHPLTWLSHIIDYQLFGLDPTGHHLIGLAIHIVNAVSLLLLLSRMTGRAWPSAFVAALFALHPLHVESVAWAAERKDLLSTLFGFLTIGAYVRYVGRRGTARYLAVLVLFVLGLLAKPMLVTLPFVLLLLDFWPLRRWQPPGRGSKRSAASLPRLVKEKLPLLSLAAASSVVTFLVQRGGGAVAGLEQWPFGTRAANGVVSYVSYLWRMVWPVDLGVLYPLSPAMPVWQVAGAASFLVLVTVFVVRTTRRAPYLATGWFWYLGTLVPVIGIVQVGGQASADRYTYIPLIGVWVMIAWGVPDLLAGLRRRAVVLGAFAALAVAACSILTWRQVSYWSDSVALFEHTLRVTEDNHVMHNNLGGVLFREGRGEAAVRHFEEARRIKPDYTEAISNLGLATESSGSVEEAIRLYREALRLTPSHLAAWFNLGNALEKTGDLDEAIACYREGLRLSPGQPRFAEKLRSALQREEKRIGPTSRDASAAELQFKRGNELRDQKKLDEAIEHYREAVQLDPDLAAAHNNLGIALALRGDVEQAFRHLSEVIRIDPRDGTAHYNLGRLLAGQRKWTEAIGHYEEALRIDPDNEKARIALDQARERLK